MYEGGSVFQRVAAKHLPKSWVFQVLQNSKVSGLQHPWGGQDSGDLTVTPRARSEDIHRV